MSLTSVIQAGFRGAGVRMTPAQLEQLADAKGYELAALEAFLDVEAGGVGFDPQGRPKILTEPHIFYRELKTKPAAQAAAVRQGLAYQVRGSQPYPPTSELNYQRLLAWCAIDPVAAMRSTSWGIGQVMGFNHEMVGFATVDAMVEAAMAGEVAQFGMMLTYLETNRLIAALRNHDWTSLAIGYNGGGNATVYAAKLQAAYRTHAAPAPLAAAPVKKTAPAKPVSSLRAGPTTDDLNDASWLRIRAGQL